MRGWLLDIYPDYDANAIVYWVKTRKAAQRVVDRAFLPRIYVRADAENLDDLERALPILGAVHSTKRVMKSTWLGEKEREILEVTLREYSQVENVAHTIDNRGKYKDFSLFNVDLRFSQRYFVEKCLFPMGLLEFRPKPRMLDDPYEIDYELPPLSSTSLEITTELKRGIPTFKDRLRSAKVGEDTVDGEEEDVLNGIQELLREKDPDVLYTEDGDSFSFPYLYERAKRLKLPQLKFGRDEDDQRTDRKGKSYFTYGQIKYKPPSYKLRGRIHIDRSSSFMYAESGLEGLIDLSRISSVPVQELSRLSPGSAISAMEVNQALRDGCVIMWKKNLPEQFKTAEELIIADRGGFIYEPRVGIHSNVLEVDFTSLYPNIMVRFNISPETVLCPCCPESKRRVPVLGYNICDRRLGLIPRVLKPVVERRTRLKRMLRAGVGDAKGYKERVDVLKWLLVTCLDASTEIPFRRNGRFDLRPVSEIVEELAGGAMGESSANGQLELFGVDENMSPSVKAVSSVFKHPAPTEMIELDLGEEKLTVTSDHPCYTLRGGDMLLRNAGDLTSGEYLPKLMPLYSPESRRGSVLVPIRVRSVRRVRPSGDFVYCFKVAEPLHGFALANGVLTHNCFGYTGYKNARFGRIECHESITAYGREILLQASEMAEAHGFEILHGIVDSLWLKGDGDPDKFCEHVSGHIGIPLEPEGVYKWIVFLPGRTHGVGVLNRYYGVFQDGKMKVRGIDLRKHDTTGLVRDLQEELLAHFSRASDAQQFIELIPSAFMIIDNYVEAVRSGTVPLDKLMMTKRISQDLEEYRQFNDGFAALMQLSIKGYDVNPGEAVRFLIQDCKSKDPKKRMKIDAFVSGDEEYDIDAYLELLLRGAEGILLPFGYDMQRLRAMYRSENPRG
ncbi:MAG TPA: DNA polymerase domain-containing protein [Thermoplasmata archaeon]